MRILVGSGMRLGPVSVAFMNILLDYSHPPVSISHETLIPGSDCLLMIKV